MTRAVVLDANLLVLLVAGQTDAHLADIPQCPTRVRSPYQSGHRNRNSGKNPIGLINVTRWIGGVSLVLRAMRLPSIMPSSRRVSAHSRIIRCPAKRLEILNHTVRQATPTMCRHDGR